MIRISRLASTRRIPSLLFTLMRSKTIRTMVSLITTFILTFKSWWFSWIIMYNSNLRAMKNSILSSIEKLAAWLLFCTVNKHLLWTNKVHLVWSSSEKGVCGLVPGFPVQPFVLKLNFYSIPVFRQQFLIKLTWRHLEQITLLLINSSLLYKDPNTVLRAYKEYVQSTSPFIRESFDLCLTSR